jgi:hypothetical protein
MQTVLSARGAVVSFCRAQRAPRQRKRRGRKLFQLLLTCVLREEDFTVRGEDQESLVRYTDLL